MRRMRWGTLDKSRLATLLGAVFLVIALLTAALIYYAHSQLKWQAFHQYRSFATSVSNSIEARLSEAIATEQQRSTTEYQFYDVSRGSGQRSELSQLRYSGEFSANLGYFQVDSNGQFSSPLLPIPSSDDTAADLLPAELSQRRSIAEIIANALGDSGLADAQVQERVAGAPELKLDAQLSKKSESYENRQRPSTRSEIGLASQSGTVFEADTASESAVDRAVQEPPAADLVEEEFPLVTTFDATLAPFQFSVLGGGHFVLFRRVVVDNESVVQGLLLQPQLFLDAEIGRRFENSALSQWGRLVVVHDQSVLAEFAEQASILPGKPSGSQADLLYEHQLTAPFGSLRLFYSLDAVPPAPGRGVLIWVSLALASVLCGGFYLLYRAGLNQLALSRQQQNFVASVTHELKTPLTSIRMYGEMLQSGWVANDKRQEYYQYIHDESQRLSRLIANVLQLADINNESLLSELETLDGARLMAGIKSAIQTQTQHSNISVEYRLDAEAASLLVRLDQDAWAQVIINLVDNAIKFSTQSDQCRLSIAVVQNQAGEVCVDFRDFGPGIPRDQRKNIFDLFYRSENELVRQTTGTGIGLSIVKQLLEQMQASIEVTNANPGANFRVSFPNILY